MEWLGFRVILSVIFGVLLAWEIYRTSKVESGNGKVSVERPRYRPYMSPIILPCYVLVAAILLSLEENDYIVQDAIFRVLVIFLHIGVYYTILLAALPYLRKWVSARVCAILWVLPNYLYIMTMIPLESSAPLVVIPLPGVSVWLLFGIWLTGFAAVLGWSIFSHLRFRRQVLGKAETVTDPVILRLWGEIQESTKVLKNGESSKRYVPIVRSDVVKTPLAIGLWRGGMYMVLPKRYYSEEELQMIFRHEIIHIGREDSWTKFFLVFCTAMCWFNPLMWIAMKRCAEDVELSCDETVLLGVEEGHRKQYAQLLLKTVGDDRGFTTCLSATGQAMRYRLGQVMNAPQKRLGLVMAGVAAMVLFMSCGLLTFSYDYRTGAELIFEDSQTYHINKIQTDLMAEEDIWVDFEENALYDYLSQLQVHRLSGEYRVEETSHSLLITCDNPLVWVVLSDQKLEVYHPHKSTRTEVYYLSQPVDWDAVTALLGQ